MDYFNRMKIHHACELIREFPSLQLAEISDKLGFNDVYYFSKVFKRITGIAPSSYRKENRNSD
jgi:YesN/AraC family two-component response regulator